VTRDESYIMLALEQARKAFAADEVPVGAVVVCDGRLLSTGYNRRESEKNPLSHAETEAIKAAAAAIGDWRLTDCEIFVTLEPCAMCAGAILNSRIRRVVFGAFDPDAGCFGSAADLSLLPFAPDIEVIGGVLSAECEALLSAFFSDRRRRSF